MLRNICEVHHFPHYYSRKCWQVVSKLAGVISLSMLRSHQILCPVPVVKLVGIMLRTRLQAHHIPHHYNLRCWLVVLEPAGVMSPSCSDHTKVSVRFQLWSWWGLCWEMDACPPLFTLLQLEIPSNGERAGVINLPWPNHGFVWFQLWTCWGLCWGIDAGSTFFAVLQPEMLMSGVMTGQCEEPLTSRSR